LKYSTLDLNDPAQLQLLRNRAVTDLYEPGSVMKVVTASAAIDAGVVTPNTTYVDTGVAKIYDTEIRNWENNVYGEQTMTQVLQNSINTGAIFMAELLGEDRFLHYLDAFGFDVPSGIELTGEAVGILRRPDDPAWSPVDLATQSFGQAISVTPIQMTTAVAAAINGGELLRPHLVQKYIHPDGTTLEQETIVRDRAVSESTSAQIRQMMDAVVNPGGYHPAQPHDYEAGGKSGTANVAIPNGAYSDVNIASFIGFAPVDDPKILVLVKLDENADLKTGTVAAGPVFADVIDKALTYMDVPPDGALVSKP
jgi:cell division protein FtsI/penicillin-binding protein 2